MYIMGTDDNLVLYPCKIKELPIVQFNEILHVN